MWQYYRRGRDESTAHRRRSRPLRPRVPLDLADVHGNVEKHNQGLDSDSDR